MSRCEACGCFYRPGASQQAGRCPDCEAACPACGESRLFERNERGWHCAVCGWHEKTTDRAFSVTR
jgi:hypothetical protein